MIKFILGVLAGAATATVVGFVWLYYAFKDMWG